jgi:hypothetical protein
MMARYINLDADNKFYHIYSRAGDASFDAIWSGEVVVVPCRIPKVIYVS